MAYSNVFSQGAGLSSVLQTPQTYGPPAPSSAFANSTSVATGKPIYSAPPAASAPKVLGSGTTQPSYTPPAPQQAPAQQQVVDNAQRLADEQKAAVEANKARVQNMYATGVNNAYNPIYQQLDKMIGFEQSELNAANTEGIQAGTREEQIANQYNTDLGGLNAIRDTGLEGISGLRSLASENQAREAARAEQLASEARNRQQGITQGNLRTVDDTTRNLMRSGLRGLGAAGDGSAAVEMSTAFARENLKARGAQIGIGQQALSAIDQALSGNIGNIEQAFSQVRFELQEKENQLKNVYASQKAELDGWKTRSLSNLVNTANQRIQELEMQKRTATAEQQAEIARFQSGIEQEAINKLEALDQQVSQLAVGLDQWAMERFAQMEDYRKQLAMSAQYSGTTSPSYQFKDYATTDPLTGEEIGRTGVVFNPADGSYSVSQLPGYQGQLMPQPEKKKGVLGGIGEFLFGN